MTIQDRIRWLLTNDCRVIQGLEPIADPAEALASIEPPEYSI